MSEPAPGEIPFQRALEILEIGPEQLESLLVDGLLKGYRRGADVVFRREDLAAYITRRSEAKPPAAPPVPHEPPRPRESRRDSIKKAAMGVAGGEMVSLKKRALEEGLLDESGEVVPAPRPAGPPEAPVEGPAVPAGPMPPAAEAPAPPIEADKGRAELDAVKAENENLRQRLQAAEEVLSDLQRRCEKASELQSQNMVLQEELQRMRIAQAEMEAKLVAYEEMESPGAEGPRWGAPEPEQQVISMKREVAEMRGELAAVKRQLEEREKDYQKVRLERDELSSKLKAAPPPGVDPARVKELEAQLESLRQERDILAIEAEVARELKGELERASELEEKLQTQREIIEAAQKGLSELEKERDELRSKVRSLEEELSRAKAGGEKAAELAAQVQDLEGKLAQAAEKVAQFESRAGALKLERDALAADLERVRAELALVRAQAEQARSDAAELEKVRAELAGLKSRASGLEAELAGIKIQVSLKDQLIEQLKAEGRNQTELAAENAVLREKLAEAETRARQTEARLVGMRSERDGLAAELSKREGAVSELRAQAERAGALLGENQALKAELDAARERLAQLESQLASLRAEREELATAVRERSEKAEALERRLHEQERDIGEIRSRVEAGPAAADSAKLYQELEAIRGEISRQVQELGQMRAQGEAAARRKSALEVASGRRRVPSVRRVPAPVAAAVKPERLGRFVIGEELRRGRSGVVYKATIQPGGQEAEVQILPMELARDRYFLDRFWREMRVIVELEEKGLQGVIDLGEVGGIHYVAYERLDAETLESILRREKTLPCARAVEIAATILEAIGAVAKEKIAHGDIKPENVLITKDGRTALTGLGLARGTDEDASSLNEQGKIVHYGAPEQILGEGRDARSDIWSAGALIYRAISGRPPIEAGSLADVRALVQVGELPRAAALAEAPQDLRDCLGKMLAEKPDDRFASAKDAAKALRKLKLS